MNLQTYLMIKQANEGISNDTAKGLNTTKFKHLTDFGLGGGLVPSSYKNKRVLPGGIAMGTTPWGGTITADCPPIVVNMRTTNSNNGVQKIIKSTLGTIGTSGPV